MLSPARTGPAGTVLAPRGAGAWHVSPGLASSAGEPAAGGWGVGGARPRARAPSCCCPCSQPPKGTRTGGHNQSAKKTATHQRCRAHTADIQVPPPPRHRAAASRGPSLPLARWLGRAPGSHGAAAAAAWQGGQPTQRRTMADRRDSESDSSLAPGTLSRRPTLADVPMWRLMVYRYNDAGEWAAVQLQRRWRGRQVRRLEADTLRCQGEKSAAPRWRAPLEARVAG